MKDNIRMSEPIEVTIAECVDIVGWDVGSVNYSLPMIISLLSMVITALTFIVLLSR